MQARQATNSRAQTSAPSPDTPQALNSQCASRRSGRASARKARAFRAPMSASPTIHDPDYDRSSPSGGGSGGRGLKRGRTVHSSATPARSSRPRRAAAGNHIDHHLSKVEVVTVLSADFSKEYLDTAIDEMFQRKSALLTFTGEDVDNMAEVGVPTACSPPLFKQPARLKRKTPPQPKCVPYKVEAATATAAPQGHVSGAQVVEMARRGCDRMRNADGRGIKEDYDVQTWNTLVELGYAPTPVSGQPASQTFRTPREFNPAAATPPLVYSTALAAKRTPSTAAEGSSPHMRMLSAAKLLARTPATARKRSLAEALASAASDACRQAAELDRSEADTQASPAPAYDSAMAMLAAVANEEGLHQPCSSAHAEPSTPISDVVRNHAAAPASHDRDDLDGCCTRPLFISPLQGLPSPAEETGQACNCGLPVSREQASPSTVHLQASFSLTQPQDLPSTIVERPSLPQVFCRYSSIHSTSWAT